MATVTGTIPMSLRSWINVVTGKMVGIDRAVKHMLVSGGRKVPYDHLIFYTGQQYQEPHSVFSEVRNDHFLAVKICKRNGPLNINICISFLCSLTVYISFRGLLVAGCLTLLVYYVTVSGEKHAVLFFLKTQ